MWTNGFIAEVLELAEKRMNHANLARGCAYLTVVVFVKTVN